MRKESANDPDERGEGATSERGELQLVQVSVSSNRNKARVLEMVDRVVNGHEVSALSEFASNPSVIGSGTTLVNAFPDLAATVRWIVAEDDIVSMYLELEGTHRGPWIWVQEPSGNQVPVGIMLAFRFDEDGLIADQWLGSNFVAMLQRMGWGVAPVGQPVPPGA